MLFRSPGCLFLSIASTLDYLGENEAAKRLMNYYNMMCQNKDNYIPTMNDVLSITKHNLHRGNHEKKLKYEITALKSIDVTTLFQNVKDNIFYHCVLSNFHAIVVYQKWIFDPAFPNAILLSEQNLRVVAQLTDNETLVGVIRKCYQYEIR